MAAAATATVVKLGFDENSHTGLVRNILVGGRMTVEKILLVGEEIRRCCEWIACGLLEHRQIATAHAVKLGTFAMSFRLQGP